MATPKKAVAKRKRKPPAKPRGRPTKLSAPVAARIVKALSLGMSYKDAAMAGGVHEGNTSRLAQSGALKNPRSIYAHFLGQIDKAAELTGIAFLKAIRKSILESPVKMREHIKKDAKGKVIVQEIHRETLPPDIKGATWWLERRFPEQFGRRDQMEHTGKVDVKATQTQERKLTLELVRSDGEVHRITRDDKPPPPAEAE